MTKKSFRKINRIIALAVLAIASTTYLLTIEPTVSFWDCGEFIASSYKLEVGHPPGNPVFQLFARFFTIFTDKENAAAAINALSAICSALTIFFLYLTIIFFARRITSRGENISTTNAISIFGAGVVGALSYCFSDTFWFSAVEAEVYAMSSLFTAVVFWAITRWYDEAEEPHSGRWIVLICFLMGLSIGVHLLNLLSIPAIVFMYFYRIREDRKYSFMELCGIFILSCLILAAVLFGIIPLLPKAAAYADLLFVNVFGLPFNSGAVTFMALLFAGLFYGLFQTLKRGKVLVNTVLLCLTTIITGFSLYATVVIRSNANTPMNENKPDNPFTLISYLNREQYPKGPIIYGEYFGADYDVSEKEYWARIGDRYVKGKSIDIEYSPESKMFFPRMWDYRDDSYIDIYKQYIGEDGRKVPGSIHLKPTFLQNLVFFFDYQLNWMYWRYFLWNFAGRQNDIHSPIPGDIFKGNWECGIGLIDRIRLGDQSDAPAYLKENKGRNHYYMLPLLLGLIGLFFQYSRDRRGCWLNFLMFFMTGIAIVIYLNQPPYQVRERDYAYAGSFYSFSIWIGLAVAAVYSWIEKRASKPLVPAVAVTALLLGVPVLMASENWDDHDRSNRYTAVEMAKNYLNSVGQNGILVTHGDNDTFPLWYAQEVEDVRTDVRIANTSLLGTDWHIDQMKYAVNESAPLDLQVGPRQYLYGTNEYVFIQDRFDTIIPLADVMRLFRHPDVKLPLTNNKEVDYIISRRFSIPVNKENIIKYGILDQKYEDQIPDEIVLTIPKDKNYLTKPEIFMLDLLSNYQWDRPLHLLSMGGDINIGLKDYLMYEGFSYKFVPIKNRMKSTEIGFADPDDLYDKMKNVYSWDALKRTDWFVDYQNFYTFCGVLSQRQLFVNVAKEMLKIGDTARAEEIIDMCQECVPEENFPLDMIYLGFSNEYMVLDMINIYYECGADEKASDLAFRFASELLQSADFFLYNYDYAKREFEAACVHLADLQDIADFYGNTELSEAIEKYFTDRLAMEE